MKRQFFTLLAGLLCLSGSVAQAAKVDTLSVRSNAMNKNVTVLTVRPDKAGGGREVSGNLLVAWARWKCFYMDDDKT